MGKGLFQVRRREPHSNQCDHWYSPQRDLSVIGPHLIKAAMHAMDPEFWEPWLKQFLDEQGISYQDILDSNAPSLLAKAMNEIVRLKDPPTAMKEVGFDELPAVYQMLFYSRLGQILLSAIWAGVKDISRPEDAPPAALQDLLDDVRNGFFGTSDANA